MMVKPIKLTVLGSRLQYQRFYDFIIDMNHMMKVQIELYRKRPFILLQLEDYCLLFNGTK